MITGGKSSLALRMVFGYDCKRGGPPWPTYLRALHGWQRQGPKALPHFPSQVPSCALFGPCFTGIFYFLLDRKSTCSHQKFDWLE